MSKDSFTNIQIKQADVGAVRAALESCGIQQTKLFARSQVDWIALYPAATEDGDIEVLKEFCRDLSATLHALALGVCVSDSSNARYLIYEDGLLVDEYETGSEPSAQRVRLFQQFCSASTTADDLEQFFSAQAIDSLKFVQALAHFLEIPRAQIGMGFNHLKEAQAGR